MPDTLLDGGDAVKRRALSDPLGSSQDYYNAEQ